MKTRDIRQTITFKASPHEVYEALMDTEKHSRFSGSRANIGRKIGEKFTAYDDYIEGTNLELVPDTRIVQSWRGSDWPEGHYSRVTFILKRVSGGTRLTFTQIGVLDSVYEDTSQGWYEYYWTPMKAMLEKTG
jgi:activator of HSP90 ATPase